MSSSIVIVIVVFITLASFVASAWRVHARFLATTRIGVISGAIESIVVLALAHTLLPWSQVPVALWFIWIAALAAGVLGTVVTMEKRPWRRAKAPETSETAKTPETQTTPAEPTKLAV